MDPGFGYAGRKGRGSFVCLQHPAQGKRVSARRSLQWYMKASLYPDRLCIFPVSNQLFYTNLRYCHFRCTKPITAYDV